MTLTRNSSFRIWEEQDLDFTAMRPLGERLLELLSLFLAYFTLYQLFSYHLDTLCYLFFTLRLGQLVHLEPTIDTRVAYTRYI